MPAVEDKTSPQRTQLVRLNLVFAASLQRVAWFICFLVVVIGGLAFFASLSQAETVMQEAAAGAIFSTIFIGAYILARCIEKSASVYTQQQKDRFKK